MSFNNSNNNNSNNLANLLQGLGASVGGEGASAELMQLLRQRQEEQSRAILAQQLAALNGLQQPQMSANESLALEILKQQHQQKQIQDYSQIQAIMARHQQPMPSINSLTDVSLAQLIQQQQQQPGSVPPAGLPPASMVNDQATLAAAGEKRKGRSGTFPQKLHQMLSDLERQEGGSEIASFLPHGRAFCIHKPRDFVKEVMPKYFRMSHFSSFQRQLNLYDFQRITEGADKG